MIKCESRVEQSKRRTPPAFNHGWLEESALGDKRGFLEVTGGLADGSRMLNRTDVCALISSRNRASGEALGGPSFCSSFLKGSSILEPTRQIRNQTSIFLVPIVMMCRKGL